MKLTRIKNPGKFEGELLVTRLAWEVAMNGMADESTEYHDLLREGHTIFLDGDPYGEKFGLTENDNDFLRSQAGVILYNSDQGFVYGAWFDSAEEMEKEWAQIQEEDAQ